VVALAGQFGCLLRVGKCVAAVILAGRSITVASRVFAFLCRGHAISFYPSHFRRFCCTLGQLHTSRYKFLFRSAHCEGCLTANSMDYSTSAIIEKNCSISRFAKIAAEFIAVVDFVAVKARRSHKDQQGSTDEW
jgi:hypothetical protein